MMTSDPNYGQSRHGAGDQEANSTAEVAKDKAADVAGGAAAAAQQVTGVAKEQVGQVAAEVGDQVKALIGQAKTELSDQAQTQQQRAAAGLHSVADQLGAMAQGSGEPGVATDLAHQAADKAHQFADWLDARDPGSVLTEVKSFARQRPGMFLLVALGAGIAAGRLARGLTADPEPQPAAAGESRKDSSPAQLSPTAQPALSSPAAAAADQSGFVDYPGTGRQGEGQLLGTDSVLGMPVPGLPAHGQSEPGQYR